VRSLDTAPVAILRQREKGRHHRRMDDPEATTLTLETLFDIRAAVYEIRDLLIEDEEEEAENS
jgi:hypothetical protein